MVKDELKAIFDEWYAEKQQEVQNSIIEQRKINLNVMYDNLDELTHPYFQSISIPSSYPSE